MVTCCNIVVFGFGSPFHSEYEASGNLLAEIYEIHVLCDRGGVVDQ